MKPSVATSSRSALPQVLTVGDIAPDCILKDANGNQVNLRSDFISGNPIVIAFCPPAPAAAVEMLQTLSRHGDEFAAFGARVFAVNAAPLASVDVGFPVLMDRQQRVFTSFTAPRDRPSIVVLRRNHHVAGF